MNSLKRSISTLGRALKRWSRYDVIAIGEVGYVPMAEVGTASTAIDPAKLLAGGPNYLAKVGQSALD